VDLGRPALGKEPEKPTAAPAQTRIAGLEVEEHRDPAIRAVQLARIMCCDRLEAHHTGVELIRIVHLTLEDIRDVMGVAPLEGLQARRPHERPYNHDVLAIIGQNGKPTDLGDPMFAKELVEVDSPECFEAVLGVEIQGQVVEDAQGTDRPATVEDHKP
jgi:hypothetical protein